MKDNIKYSTKLALIACLVVLLAVHVGNILFGENSIKVLNSIKNDEKRLKSAITILKNENSALQKEYFELKELDPDIRKDR